MTAMRCFRSVFLPVFLITLFCLTPLSLSHADDNDDDWMPMMGGMGMGGMGMGGMGMGGMGMGGMGMGGMGMGGGMGMYNAFALLDLSDAQRKALRDIQRKARTERLALEDKIVELSDQLYTLYNQDKPDAGKIGDVYQQIFNLRRQMIELQIRTRNQQYDKLTKEQQDKLKEFRTGRMMPYGPQHYRGMMPHMMR